MKLVIAGVVVEGALQVTFRPPFTGTTEVIVGAAGIE
jgi:hypothetical protein